MSGERKSGIPADVLMPVCSSSCCYMALEKLKYLRRPARKENGVNKCRHKLISHEDAYTDEDILASITSNIICNALDV